MLRLYDKSKVNKKNLLFSTKDLWKILIPVILEQLLNSFMGMMDTMMVSNIGEEAISAVSLVDSINVLVIQLFSALATGGTILCSQYIGSRDAKMANATARQVTIAVTLLSLILALSCIVLRGPILGLIFGKIERKVMENSLTYFWITALSFPSLALFSAGSAFYRACGNTRYPMMISIISNGINVGGNALFIFVCGWGVAGAAIATLISRIFCMVVVFWSLRKPKQTIVINQYHKMRMDLPLIRRVLRIGIPSGIENSMFQFGKLVIQSSVSILATSAIAAQAMAIIFENLNGIGGIGVGIAMMTVVGQCIGAGRKEEARYYIVKMTLIGEAVVIVSCIVVLAISKPVMFFAGMTAESTRMCFEMLLAISLVKPLVWTLSFIPSYGLRAAGDVRFSMLVSSITMWACRVALATYLIRVAHFGPIAVWIGMFADWSIRSVIFSIRFLGDRWLNKRVI